MKIFITTILLIAAFFISGCASKYGTMSKYYGACGYEQQDFPEFSECLKEKNPLPDTTGSFEGKKETRHRDPVLESFHEGLTSIESRFEEPVGKKKLPALNKQAYEDYNGLILECQAKEKKANETAVAFAAVMLVGAGAVACANNGGCGGGGGGYQSAYDGNCPCPYSLDAAGHTCGARSAYSRSGGASPMCY